MAMDAAKFATFDWNMITGEVHWSANLESLVGMPAGSFARTFAAFARLVHPDDLERVQRAVADSTETGVAYEVEFRMIRGDGSVRWMQARGKAIFERIAKARDAVLKRLEELSTTEDNARERMKLRDATSSLRTLENILRNSPKAK
jgi:PAS domain-containing protein